MISLRARLRAGVFWNVAAAISTQGATFLTALALSNFAGITNFGRYSMIQNTLTTVCGLSSLSMGYTTAKYISEFRSTDRDRAARLLSLFGWIALCTAAIAAVLLLGGANTIAARMLKDSGLTTGMKIGAAFLFFTTLNSYQLGALSGLEAYRSLAVAATLSGVVTILAAIGGLFLFGIPGAVFGQSLGSAFRYFVHRHILKSQCLQAGIVPTRGRLPEQASVISRFAVPAALSGYLSIPAAWFGTTILFRQADGPSQLAIYTAALTLKTILLFLPNTITGVTLSVINHTKATTDLGQYLRLYRYNIGIVFGVVLSFAIPFMLFGGTLLRAFGRDFPAGRQVLLLLVLSTIADGITVAAYPLFQSQGKMWLSFWALAVPRDTLFALLAYLWVPLHGAQGLAQAQLTVSIIVAVSSITFASITIRGLLRSAVSTEEMAMVIRA